MFYGTWQDPHVITSIIIPNTPEVLQENQRLLEPRLAGRLEKKKENPASKYSDIYCKLKIIKADISERKGKMWTLII